MNSTKNIIIASILAIIGLIVSYFLYADYKKNQFIEDFQTNLKEKLEDNSTIEDSLETYELFLKRSKDKYYKGVLPEFIEDDLKDDIEELEARLENNEQKKIISEKWDRIKNSNDKEVIKDFIEDCDNCHLVLDAENRLEEIEENERRQIEAELEAERAAELRAERERERQDEIERKRREDQRREANKTYRLNLHSLKCYAREDITEKDEIYILVDNRRVIQGKRMDNGSLLDLNNLSSISFKNSIEIEVYDDDTGDFIGGDDKLLSLTVTNREAGRGKKQRDGRHYSAHYRLYYSVEEN